jgi:hypothetical protein
MVPLLRSPIRVLHACALVLLGAALSCSSPSDQALRADLTLYLQRATDWAPAEAETARTIDRILATQFVDEAEVRRQVTDDTPRVTAHLARIEAIIPTSQELRDVHARYVGAWRDLATGYVALLRGLDTGNVPDIAAGRRAMEAWRESIVGVARDLRRLKTQADL